MLVQTSLYALREQSICKTFQGAFMEESQEIHKALKMKVTKVDKMRAFQLPVI